MIKIGTVKQDASQGILLRRNSTFSRHSWRLVEAQVSDISPKSQQSSSIYSTNYAKQMALEAQQQLTDLSERQAYFHIVTQSFLYIQRPKNEDFHHEAMKNIIIKHFNLTQLIPTPNTNVGSKLTRCGYFLAAYAILLAKDKTNSQPTIIYLRTQFQTYDLQFGREEMQWYLRQQRFPKTESKSVRVQRQYTPIKRTSTRTTIADTK